MRMWRSNQAGASASLLLLYTTILILLSNPLLQLTLAVASNEPSTPPPTNDTSPLDFTAFRLPDLAPQKPKRGKPSRVRRSIASEGRDRGEEEGRVVLVVCHGFLDRLLPLVMLAQELASRGFQVVVATHEDARRWVPEGASLKVETLGLVGFEDERVHDVFDRVGTQTSFALGVRQLMSDIFFATSEEMYNSVSGLIQRVGPAHIVADELAFGVLEAAETHGVQATVNSPTNMLNFFGLRRDAHQPEMGSGYGKYMSLWERSYNTFIPLLTKNTLHSFMNRLEQIGDDAGDDSRRRSYSSLLSQSTILVNTAVGFECPVYAPPNVEYTGPLVPLEKGKVQSGGEDALNLGDSFYSCEDKEVILVYFGLWGAFSALKERVVTALQHFCIVLLTSVIPEDSALARIVDYEADRLTVLEAEETSIWEVLGDSVVKLAVSNCDLSFSQQAILKQKPLLCLPLYGDQLDVAARVVDAGVGIRIDRADPELESRIIDTTNEILEGYEGYVYNCSKTSSFLTVNGEGVLRAADAVQEAVLNGNASRRFYIPAAGRDSFDVALCVVVVITLFCMVQLFACLIMAQACRRIR